MKDERTLADRLEKALEGVPARKPKDRHARFLVDERDITEAAQALRSQPSVEEWRPIETAPKDGTRVLLGRFDQSARDTAVGFWSGRGTWDDGDFADDMGEFTHWQPLPEPPRQIKALYEEKGG